MKGIKLLFFYLQANNNLNVSTNDEYRLRFILIGERFFHNFQSLEIIEDMYQYTEAFCHYS